MNRINGNILIGSVKSVARYENAKIACKECIKSNINKSSRIVISLSDGICEVCEEKKEKVYMLF